MIYLCRVPRALALLATMLVLGAIGLTLITGNVVYAAFTSESWREAFDRAGAHIIRGRR